jgi:hypothetical protein
MNAGDPTTWPVRRAGWAGSPPAVSAMPKSQQHRSPVLAEHHIRGLDVAVHDTGRVHGAQRGEQLQAQRGDHRRRQSTPASAQHGGQAGTLVVVHHQPVRAVVHHHVVHDGHVRMPDPGREPGLDPAVCVVDLLDGDVAVQQFVAGSPHPCRRPAAHDLGQPVTTGQQQTGVGIGGRRPFCRKRHDRRARAFDDHDGAASTTARSRIRVSLTE